MIYEVVVRERDLVEAIEIVHRVFAEPDSGVEQVRALFAMRWAAWGEPELMQALRAALVVH